MVRNTKIVSLSLSKKHHNLFLELKEKGYFPSVSAGVRYCINNMLIKLIIEVKKLNDYIQDNNIIDVVKTLREFGYIVYRGKQRTKGIPILSMIRNNKIEVIQ